MAAQTTNQFFNLKYTMRIPKFMFLLAFILMAVPLTGQAQCLHDAQLKTSSNDGQGGLSIVFKEPASDVEVHWKDLSDNKMSFTIVELGEVQKAQSYAIFENQKPSAFLILLTAAGCDPKFSSQTFLITSDDNE